MFTIKTKKSSAGFTLVELLIVLSIMALLSAVIFSSFAIARKKSRVAKRVSDLKQVQASLEFYYAANRAYPSTGGAWLGYCPNGGTTLPNNSIPGLVPNFIPAVPTDPQSVSTSNSDCYLYKSDGVNWAFRDDSVDELLSGQGAPNYLTYPELIDPARDGGSNNSIVDGNTVTAWKVFSPVGISW